MNSINESAAQLGRMGGKKGGPARAAKLTAAHRKLIATIAANKRWNRTPKLDHTFISQEDIEMLCAKYLDEKEKLQDQIDRLNERLNYLKQFLPDY